MPKFSAYMRGEKGIQGETGQASLLDGIVDGFDNLPNRADLAEDRNYVYYAKENDGIHLYTYEGGSGNDWQDLGVVTAGFSTIQYASASTKEWYPNVQPDVTIIPHDAQQTTGLKSFDFHFNIPESQPAGFSTNQSTSVSTLDWNENATVEIIPDENSFDWEKSFLFKFGIPHGREAGFSTTQKANATILSWTENPTVSITTDENSPFYSKVYNFEFGIPQGEPAGFSTLSATVELLDHLANPSFEIVEGGTNREKDLDFQLKLPRAHPAGFSTVTANAYDLEWNENPEVSITTSGNDWEKNFDFSFGIPHGRPAGFSTEMGVSVTTLDWNKQATVSIAPDLNSPNNAKKFDFNFGIPRGEPAGFGTLSATVEILENHLANAELSISSSGSNLAKDIEFQLKIPQAHPAGINSVSTITTTTRYNIPASVSATATGNDWEKDFKFEFSIPEGRPAGFADEMEVSVTTLSSMSDATVSITPDETTPDYAKKFNFEFGIPNGVPGGFGNISVSTQQVDPATPASVSITTSGPESAKNFDFLFKIPQGKNASSAGGAAGVYIKRTFTSTNIDSTSTLYWNNNILYIKNLENNTIPICIINNQNQNIASTFKIDKENENILYYSDSPFDGTVYLIAESVIPEFIVHSVSTVSNTTPASVEIDYLDDDLSMAFLNFSIPKGEKGDTALSIDKINVNTLENIDDEPYAEVTTDINQKIEMTFYLPRGLDGADGIPGPKGDSALTIDSVNVYSLSSDAEPYATTHISESSAIIDFYLPKGDKGDQGDIGVGISSINNLGTIGLTTTYQINYTSTNITPTTFEVINGSKGDQGEPGKGITSINNLGTIGLTTTYQINYGEGLSTTFEVVNGEKGDIGLGITSIDNLGTIGLTTTYQINYGEGLSTTFEVISGKKGDKGDKGDTALTISNISITTLAEGETNPRAEVTTDANHDVSIEFHLPRGATGTGISSITKGQSEGLIDNYTINYDNGTTTGYQITNGNGINSITFNSLSETGNVYNVNYSNGTIDTILAPKGPQGIQGIQGIQGEQGIQGIQGEQGIQGDPGPGILSITKGPSTGLIDNYKVDYGEGLSTTFQITNGNGISTINKEPSNGLIDNYKINYTNGTSTTFQVTNGAKGETGSTGVGISSIDYVDSEGLQDIYRINLTNNSYYDFTITNGAVVGDIRSIIYTTTDPGPNTALTTGDIILVYDEE